MYKGELDYLRKRVLELEAQLEKPQFPHALGTLIGVVRNDDREDAIQGAAFWLAKCFPQNKIWAVKALAEGFCLNVQAAKEAAMKGWKAARVEW